MWVSFVRIETPHTRRAVGFQQRLIITDMSNATGEKLKERALSHAITQCNQMVSGKMRGEDVFELIFAIIPLGFSIWTGLITAALPKPYIERQNVIGSPQAAAIGTL